MLQKFNKLIVVLLLAAFTVTSCAEDFLETTPTDAISETDAFASPDNMFLVLNGMHRNMYGHGDVLPGGSFQRTGESHYLPSLDAIGGNIIHSSPGNGWMRADLQWLMHTNANATTVRNHWYQRYNHIAAANNLINKVDEGGYAKADPQIANILGQAYAYRAWAYWRLVTTYAKGYLIGNPSTDPGVPLLLNAGAPYTSTGRGTVQEVYDQIQSDINASFVHYANASSPANKSHISANAAHGINARIALSKGDWSTAATEAALARAGYPLMDESKWLSGFNDVEGNDEVIWGATMIQSETNFFASYFYYVSPTFNGSQNRTNPKIISKTLYDAIPDTDFRTKAWLPDAPNTYSSAANDLGGDWEAQGYASEDEFDEAKAAVISEYGMTSGHNTHPYMNVKFLQSNPGTIEVDDLIFMRASEMYLIEAEARAMMTDITGAQTVLQEFGSARDSSYDSSIYGSKEALMAHIKWQRRVELHGEGFSYHDQIRWDEGIDQSDSGASFNLYRDGFMVDRPSINDAWVWKIPQDEINANPNINEADQN
ncbi:RagB/SusD family nutrient uptake outer membrane protein [Algibacter sp. 2305UL17-15]|uniref:RagB/SusD family nutrient uptake outer membrane protein n=1 Tax=Algibacter sp. 2305UL17-15 TaxID=3231268 RepID=UPI003459E70E